VSTRFDDDTALTPASDGSVTATVSGDWTAGRGPHGGYIAAIILRALMDTVADPARQPRSLTVHYARAPEPGPVTLHTVLHRAGRSVSTLSARLTQANRVVAVALATFSVAWSGPEIDDSTLPEVSPPDSDRVSPEVLRRNAPPFARHLVMQPRLGAAPFSGSHEAMEIGGWIGLAEPRTVDALSLALYSDAWFSPPYVRLERFVASPTLDLTVHFRAPLPRSDPQELCLARFTSTVVRDGFFEEDGVIWAPDGTVLAQSRQLALLIGV